MRKTFIYYLLGSLALLMLWIGLHYATTGRIIITTDNADNTISLFSLKNENSEKPIVEDATTSVSKRLRPGKYIVKVQSKTFTTNKIVNLKARETLRYAINSVGLAALEPVRSSAAHSILADASSLMYVEPVSQTLFKIDAQNNIQSLDSIHAFTSIEWADASYGVGKGEGGQLYAVNNGSVGPLPMPYTTDDNKSVVYDVGASRQIFVSHSSDIYSGSEGSGFKKIFTTKSPSPGLAAWGERVAVLDGPGDINDRDIPPLVTILDKSGRVLAKKSIEAPSATWSTNGKYLAINAEEGSELEVVDSSLQEIAAVPVSSVSSFVWADDLLYYTVAEELWSFDVSSGTSRIVAKMPIGTALSDVSFSSDKSYLYLTATTGDDTGGTQMYRYGLRGQKPPEFIFLLPSFLPDNSQLCSLGYVNFTRPTIVGESEFDPNQNCAAAVQTVFEPYGIAKEFLDFHFSLAANGE